jgi:hypothetical protein
MKNLLLSAYVSSPMGADQATATDESRSDFFNFVLALLRMAVHNQRSTFQIDFDHKL